MCINFRVHFGDRSAALIAGRPALDESLRKLCGARQARPRSVFQPAPPQLPEPSESGDRADHRKRIRLLRITGPHSMSTPRSRARSSSTVRVTPGRMRPSSGGVTRRSPTTAKTLARVDSSSPRRLPSMTTRPGWAASSTSCRRRSAHLYAPKPVPAATTARPPRLPAHRLRGGHCTPGEPHACVGGDIDALALPRVGIRAVAQQRAAARRQRPLVELVTERSRRARCSARSSGRPTSQEAGVKTPAGPADHVPAGSWRRSPHRPGARRRLPAAGVPCRSIRTIPAVGVESTVMPPPTPSETWPRSISNVRMATLNSSPAPDWRSRWRRCRRPRGRSSSSAIDCSARCWGTPLTEPGGKHARSEISVGARQPAVAPRRCSPDATPRGCATTSSSCVTRTEPSPQPATGRCGPGRRS